MKIAIIGYDHLENALILKFENGKVIKHFNIQESDYEKIKELLTKEEKYEFIKKLTEHNGKPII